MLSILSHRAFRQLFMAQISALVGTGLLTVALGLLAFEIAGAEAGRVLGIALTIKMVAYVGLSPLITALVAGLDRRLVMVCADLIRAAVAFSLPFIDAAWQIYALIFVLQACSATFTPTFQSVIPEVLPDEDDYTSALSLSRLAYDLENLLSPVVAALLLTVLAPSMLFVGTAVGFLVSAGLVQATPLPRHTKQKERPFIERVALGSRIYLATPRLRGLLALNVTVSMIGAVVLVQSVVIAKGIFGGADQDLAVLMGAFGGGSMVVALLMPAILRRVSDRTTMLIGACGLTVSMGAGTGAIMLFGWPSWGAMLLLWALLGAANAAVMTPSGRILRRSAHSEDRPAVFAAHFALSHACWLVAYPLIGLIGAEFGLPLALFLATCIGGAALVTALRIWPPNTSEALEHSHDDLPPDHPHLKDAERQGNAWVHRHPFVIDDEHRVWPTSG